MERLTSNEKRISGQSGVCCTHFNSLTCYQYTGHCSDGCPWNEAAWNRLAAYEDTGLTPEDIRAMYETIAEVGAPLWKIKELWEAETDGRLEVAPCKAGTAVYIVERDEDGKAFEVSGYMFLAKVGESVICTAYINCLETVEETLQYHIEETAANYDTDLAVFPWDDCFLTREEAEAHLANLEPPAEMDWGAAKERLDFYMDEYKKIGPAGALGMMVLRGLKTRYDAGERTPELYEEMMDVE